MGHLQLGAASTPVHVEPFCGREGIGVLSLVARAPSQWRGPKGPHHTFLAHQNRHFGPANPHRLPNHIASVVSQPPRICSHSWRWSHRVQHGYSPHIHLPGTQLQAPGVGQDQSPYSEFRGISRWKFDVCRFQRLHHPRLQPLEPGPEGAQRSRRLRQQHLERGGEIVGDGTRNPLEKPSTTVA